MKITKVRFSLLRFPLVQRYGNASGLKSERVSLIVRLETGDGIIGWGEAFAYRTSPFNWAEVSSILTGTSVHSGNSVVDRIASYDISLAGGVDIALWDLRGKIAGMSVADLLGGRYRDAQPAYASLHNVNEATDVVADAVREAQAAIDMGFRALKMKVGWHPVEKDQEWVNAVIESLPAGVALALDANRSMDLQIARRFIRGLKNPDRIAWFEEPVTNKQPRSYSELRQSLDVPIAGGETMPASVIHEVVRTRAMDIINPDLVGHGGFERMSELWHTASVNGVRNIPHIFDGQISRVATLHFLASKPDWSETRSHFRAAPLEYDIAPNPLRDEILSENLMPDENGCIAVPTGPGLGIEVSEALIKRYVVAEG